jgi:hypothetical protein
VVTVADRAWVATLDADGLPLDWRFHDPAHEAFVADRRQFLAVLRQALAITQALNLGYSSQDWIETNEGELVFLDLNPAGQWLFLPDEIAGEVTVQIAEFLTHEGA